MNDFLYNDYAFISGKKSFEKVYARFKQSRVGKNNSEQLTVELNSFFIDMYINSKTTNLYINIQTTLP